MTTVEDAGDSVLRYRVTRHDARLDVIEEWRRAVDDERATTRGDLKVMHDDLGELKQAVESVTKTLIGFAVTIATSAVGFSLAVLIATGKL